MESALEPLHLGRRMKAFAAMAAMGLPAALSIALLVPATIAHTAPGKPLPLPMALLQAIAATQTFALIALFALVGAFAAPACGLRSIVFERAAGRTGAGAVAIVPALATGVIALALAVVVDEMLLPYYGAAWNALKTLAPDRAAGLLVGVLYGGIGEEILLRWGLMSALVVAGWKLFARASATPPARVMWAAIAISALAFGAAHLPVALALASSMPPVLVARTLLLNAIIGCGFGWLYWRRNLETAMLAHATFHVASFVASPLLP